VADPPLNDPERRTRVREARERATDARDRANERMSDAVGRANDRVSDAKQRARDMRARTKTRLFGLDRSGPPPLVTQSGQPLNPWTVPNAIGFVRLALIPVFLVIALSSSNGKDTLAVVLFAVIGWSDYLDGFTARLTGQFSRLGTLLDPITDRCLIIAGMAVCWRFSLLPRWALYVVIGREVFMLCLSRYAIHRTAEIKINWFGRLAVAPILGAPFFAMANLRLLSDVLLYIGMALSLMATAAYVRVGFRDYGAKARTRPSS
jgi:cardiolipin synthase